MTLRKLKPLHLGDQTTFESLEDRLLMTIDGLEANLLFVNAPGPAVVNPIVFGSGPVVTSAPSVNGGSDVRDRTATVSVRATDDGGDSKLKYTWVQVAAPPGGKITFSTNGSNAAQNNTLKFSLAGLYEVRVDIVDRSGLKTSRNLQLNVLQEEAGVMVKTSSNKVVNASSGLITTSAAESLNAVVCDQFGTELPNQPNITWSVLSSPSGATATLDNNGNAVSAEFDQVGTYVLRAAAGTNLFDVKLNVKQTLTSINLADANNVAVDLDRAITIEAATATLRVNGYDQFGNAMTSIPRLTWSTISAPPGGRVSATSSGSNATLKATTAGTYTLLAKYGAISASVALEVVPTFTSLLVRGADNRSIAANRALTITGTSHELRAEGLDQFAKSLVTQPNVTWQLVSAPAGGSATLTSAANDVVATFTKAGTYTLRAASGSVATNIILNVAQTLSTLSAATPDGSPLDAHNSLTVSDKLATILVRGTDQFGDAITTLPSIKWTTTAAPQGGRVTTTLSGGQTKLNFTRVGSYQVQATYLSSTVGFTTEVTPVLASYRVVTSDNKPLVNNRGWNVTGTSGSFTAIGLDQFGATLTNQPAVTWQVVTSPTEGTATLTTSDNTIDAAFDRTGTYVLEASSGGASFRAVLNVMPSLTVLELATPDGASVDENHDVDVATTKQDLRMTGYDQFGNAMTALPRVVWTATSEPAARTFSVSQSGSNLTVNFQRVGRYQIRGQYGSVATTFAANVVSVFTTIGLRNTNNAPIPTTKFLTVAGDEQQITAVALDQFGGELSSQPTIAWSTLAAPVNAECVLEVDGNRVVAGFDGSGTYKLQAQSGDTRVELSLNIRPTITGLRLLTTDGTSFDTEAPLTTDSNRQSLLIRSVDQFGKPLTSFPSVSWVPIATPTGGRASISYRSGRADFSFTRAGLYTLQAKSGSAVTRFSFQVNQVATTLVAIDANNTLVNTRSAISVRGAELLLTARVLDQFGQPMLTQSPVAWSNTVAPNGAQPTLTNIDNQAAMTFDRAGSYTFLATVGDLALNANVSVISQLTSISISPGTTSVSYRGTQQFLAEGLDQFSNALSPQPKFTWSATGGTITSSGNFTAGSATFIGTVTAKYGSISQSATVQVTSPDPQSDLQDQTISNLVTTLYADNEISRLDMIQILRSAGTDGIVSFTELSDFQFLVSSDSPYAMPDYVRSLAYNTTYANPANLKFRGQTAGNLATGSSSTLLNNLVDKWFLGADEPVITSGSNLTYQTATAPLFSGNPSRANAKQGVLGDCYFVASLASIADENATAVRDMFLDNGDGTYTVRFFAGEVGSFYNGSLISSGFLSGSGVADYVTVNSRLPAYPNGTLGYSGFGLSITASTTPLWIPLAEKAYAQWNETGNSGRDGTNRYAAIEGGWMSDVNAQVLGYNSTSYPLTATTKQAMINALNLGQAVTIGTKESVSSGLISGHAYIVTAYNSSTAKFSLHNPWGTSHPAALTWSQMQSNGTMFVVTNAATGGAIQSSVVQSMVSTSHQLVGIPQQLKPRTEWEPTASAIRTVEDQNLATESPHESPEFLLTEASEHRDVDSEIMDLLVGLDANFEVDGLFSSRDDWNELDVAELS